MDTIGLFDYMVKDVGGPRDLSHFLGTTTFGLDNQQMGEERQVEEVADGSKYDFASEYRNSFHFNSTPILFFFHGGKERAEGAPHGAWQWMII